MLTRRLVRISAMQALYAFFVQKDSLSATQKQVAHLQEQLAKDISVLRAIHMHYWQMMLFWAALDGKEVAKKPSSPRCSLGLMAFLAQLKQNKFFIKYSQAYRLKVPRTLLKRCYYERIVPSELYKKYQEEGNPSLKEEKRFLAGFFRDIFQEAKEIQDYFEDEWSDKELFSPVLEKCVLFFIQQFVRGTAKSFSLYEEETFDASSAFYKALTSHTLAKAAEYEERIKQHTHNWDVHRLILLDKLLLKMALAEQEAFPKRPKSVVFNEYIEIAKIYSSPKSYRFINGLLDAIIPAGLTS